jgi:putative ubiquitin-RnfH superfamily antitoxin RatB of RatAB toxin-antitoxin module
LKVTVVYALPRKAQMLSLELADDACVEDAMKIFLGHCGLQPVADLTVGIHGRAVASHERLHDGDRVEIYRALIANPKEIRRSRLRRKSTSR